MRALILLNGELDYATWVNTPGLPHSWDVVICADGGARHALALGVPVDILIGDFDSLSPAQRNQLRPRRTITLPTDKNCTDGEMALAEALRIGADHITLVAALGGRLDHTLANISLLKQVHNAGATGLATDGRQSVYLVTQEIQLTGVRGQTFSVLPNPPTASGVTISGARWPLTQVRLEWGCSRGVSNEFADESVHIRVEQGELLVIVTHALVGA